MTTLESVKGDITTMSHDAIVNAANSNLSGGGGVDGAIHRAGGPTILEECRAWVSKNGRLPTGQAMATGAGDLKARHVIHTVGPIWMEHDADESQRLLADCYRNSLQLASEMGLASLAFPNISTGAFGYPKRPAGEVAVATTRDWLAENDDIERITFVCFGDENARIYEDLLGS